MSESKIESAVCAYAKRNFVMVLKLAAAGHRGQPDRMFLANGKTLFIEFKSPGKRPTALQLRFHDTLRILGFRVFVIDNLTAGIAAIDEFKTPTLPPQAQSLTPVTDSAEWGITPHDMVVRSDLARQLEIQRNEAVSEIHRFKAPARECKWIATDGGVWTTGCAVTFIGGGDPDDNGQKFCGYCGGGLCPPEYKTTTPQAP